MKSKKKSKSTTRDKDWQKKVEERTKAEKVELSHPKGNERFSQVIKRMMIKKKG